MKRVLCGILMSSIIMFGLTGCVKGLGTLKKYNHNKVEVILMKEIDKDKYNVFKKTAKDAEETVFLENEVIQGETYYSFKSQEFIYVGADLGYYKVNSEGTKTKMTNETGKLAFDDSSSTYVYSKEDGVYYNNGSEDFKVLDKPASELYIDNSVITIITEDRTIYQSTGKIAEPIGKDVKELISAGNLSEQVFFLNFKNELYCKNDDFKEAQLVDKITKEGEELFYDVFADVSGSKVIYNKASEDMLFTGVADLYVKDIKSSGSKPEKVATKARTEGFAIKGSDIYYTSDKGELMTKDMSATTPTKIMDGIKSIDVKDNNIMATGDDKSVHYIKGDAVKNTVKVAKEFVSTPYGDIYKNDVNELHVDKELVSKDVFDYKVCSNLIYYENSEGTYIYNIAKEKSYEFKPFNIDGFITFGGKSL